MATLFPEEPQNQEQPPPSMQALQRRRFISVSTDAIEDEFKAFQDHTLPLAERVRAGHRLLSAAASALAKFEADVKDKDKKTSYKLRAFLKAYSAPRIRMAVVKTSDRVFVYRISVGGATESSSDVAMEHLQVGLRAVEDQRHEMYYNTVLAPIIGAVMGKLARCKIVREHPRELGVSFTHIMAPLRGGEGEEDEEDDLSDEEGTDGD